MNVLNPSMAEVEIDRRLRAAERRRRLRWDRITNRTATRTAGSREVWRAWT